MKILYQKHNEIDFSRWDNTINESSNALPYALSWYLDIVSPGWEAIVSEDYNYVFPLTIKRKMGIKGIVQAPLTQQLGLFSSKEITKSILNQFLKKIPFFYYRLHLNEGNFWGETENSRINYVLSLNRPYSEIRNTFSGNTLRNIQKANNQNFCIKSVTIDEFLPFLLKNNPHISTAKNIIPKLLTVAQEKNYGEIIGAYGKKNELVAATFFLHFKQRKIYLLPASSTIGKQYSAMFFIIDSLIKQDAESNIILDFEGSMIEGIARFYKGFGATKKYYPTANSNLTKWITETKSKWKKN